MAGTQYNLQFKRLCHVLQLGNLNGIDTEEQYMGMIQVTDTVDVLRRYAKNMIQLENYLNYEID